jgi:hypothetical protein
MSILYPEWKQRLEICRGCEFSQSHLNGKVTSCGELIVGSLAKIDNEYVELCGCVMELKTRLPLATCPANKWNETE